jgi:hypothetical protein
MWLGLGPIIASPFAAVSHILLKLATTASAPPGVSLSRFSSPEIAVPGLLNSTTKILVAGGGSAPLGYGTLAAEIATPIRAVLILERPLKCYRACKRPGPHAKNKCSVQLFWGRPAGAPLVLYCTSVSSPCVTRPRRRAEVYLFAMLGEMSTFGRGVGKVSSASSSPGATMPKPKKRERA